MKTNVPNLHSLTLLAACCAVLPVTTRADELVKPVEVRRVFANGKHNAFTAMRRFGGQLWLAFRSGDAHNSATADVLVLRSTDGRDWKHAHTFEVAKDDRDPQMVVAEKRLYLYCPSMNGRECDSWLAYTDDGQTWSVPRKIYKPQFILFADSNLTPWCHLPAGGDCAYLDAVEDGPNMLVSYYSSHEDGTHIYLAVVPLNRG